MLAKEIKTPMIIGMILYGIAILIDLMVYAAQVQVARFYISSAVADILKEKKIIPGALWGHLTLMLLFVITFYVINNYMGQNRRTIGIIFTVIYVLFNIASPYVTMLTTVITARMTSMERLAASSSLNSAISVLVVPFVVPSTVLYVIGLARYGVSIAPMNIADTEGNV